MTNYFLITDRVYYTDQGEIKFRMNLNCSAENTNSQHPFSI